MHHPAIPTFGRTGCVSRVDGDHGTANAQFTTTQCMIMFRIIPFVCQNTPWSQVGRRLSYRGSEVGRILARSQPNNRSRDELRSGVKHSGQFRPGRMGKCALTTPSLKVRRGVPRFQTRRVDRRRVRNIICNQATIASTVAASRKESLESPFSRSFCSTCHSVE